MTGKSNHISAIEAPLRPSDISVIVQGSVDPRLTPLCLESIRRVLPGAEIILSTWRGAKTDGLTFDRLVSSIDPGSTVADAVHGVANNVNRQIVSTAAGLAAAQRPHALKIRSDMRLTNTNFMTVFGTWEHLRQPDCRVFDKRIVINNLYCADPRKTGFLFHLSDWVQFGTHGDLVQLWDIPLQSEAEASYFRERPRPPRDAVPTWLFRWIPEQYIWKTCLERAGVPVALDYFGDVTPEATELADRALANNTIILDYPDYGIEFLKFDPYKWDATAQMTHGMWRVLVRRHCGPIDFPLSALWSILRADRKVLAMWGKLRKQARRFARPFELTARWLKSAVYLLVHSARISVTALRIVSRARRGVP